MKSIKIYPSTLKGEVTIPPSKSAAHRAIICAALSKGISVISPLEYSQDIKTTINSLIALGAEISFSNGVLTVDGTNTFSKTTCEIDCAESGSTLRFLMPIAAAGGINATFSGQGRLPDRPIGIYNELFPLQGVTLSAEKLPLTLRGKLHSGEYKLAGDISSQFVTGLLLALPLLKNDSEIILTTPLQSVGYVDMTIDIMAAFGVKIETTENGYHIKGGQSYKPTNFKVEGDWSQATFFLAAGALGGDIAITNLNPTSKQGDREAEHLFKSFGANITWQNGKLLCKKDTLHGIKIDATQIPDLVPALAVIAAFAKGETTLFGAERLRIKESDRIKSVCSGLLALGANVTETPDGMIIQGSKLSSGTIDGFNDHRIVMAFSILATYLTEPSTISDMDSINKSYPSFFEDFKTLGGAFDVINNR